MKRMNHMIENGKIVHCCWFGKEKMPQRYVDFLENNKKFFPGYQFIVWTEDNFDIYSCDYAAQAYDKGKYAFVSDYVRMKVLYEYGGIYLDLDVEFLKKFSDIEAGKEFMGFERRKYLGTAVISLKKHSIIAKKMLDYYENNPFLSKNGAMDTVANVSLLTEIMVEEGLVVGGEKQKVSGIDIYPREYFYPKKLGEGVFRTTEQTVAIHYCDNSWMSAREKKRGNSKIWISFFRPLLQKAKKVLISIFGSKATRKIEIKIRNILK